MTPKLLVVTSTFPRWQNDTDPPFVYELSRHLTDTFKVTIHAPYYPGAKTREIMDGMHVHRFRYFIKPFEKLAGTTGILPTLKHNKLYYLIVPFFLLSQGISLLLLVRKMQPDVIHAHWIVPQGFTAVLVKRITGIPVVVTAHGGDVFGLQGLAFNIIKRFTLTRADVVTAVSEALADVLSKLTGLGPEPDCIPMGVNSEIFSPVRVQRKDMMNEKYGLKGPCLLYVGRLTEKKGVRYLIDAMRFVLQAFPLAQLLIVGGGELENDLKNQVAKGGLRQHIQFVGGVPNKELPQYYAAADIFIGPSIVTKQGDTEGFGLTFVEAAMSGCLVIASDTGGIRDIIQDNETGFLVPQKDSEALADKIVYALSHQHEILKIKETARKRCVKKYDWMVVSRRYAELFLALVQR